MKDDLLERQTDRHADRQKDDLLDRQTDRQTDRRKYAKSTLHKCWLMLKKQVESKNTPIQVIFNAYHISMSAIFITLYSFISL